MSYKTQIIEKIASFDSEKVFIVKDFIDIAKTTTVRSILNDLVKSNFIVRVMEGLYNKPEYIEMIDAYTLPSVDEIAHAIARKNNWRIYQSGNMSLNLLGLSTQVPAKYVFITDGKSTQFKYEKLIIEFKRQNSKDLSKDSVLTNMVIQALKTIKKPRITSEQISHLSKRIPDNLKPELLKNSKNTSAWLHKVIAEICEV